MQRVIKLTTGLALTAAMAAMVPPSTAAAAKPGTAPAGAAAAPVARGFAYVWGNQPTTASYAPAAAYSRNSTGAVNTITRTATGRYIVRMPNLGTAGGTAHATAYGTTNATCQVNAWLVAGTAINLYVQCNAASGALADNRFTASFTKRPPALRFGHVWADQPAAASYTPSATYQGNSTGGTNTVLRQGAGNYLVRMPGLGSASGHVQVTAYGYTAARCKVVNWGPTATTQFIRVNCRNTAGRLFDTRYSLTYTDRSGVLWANTSAYVWANSPSAASYVPAAPYQFNTTGAKNSVRRLGQGSYLVALPGQALNNGTVHVTAYGTGSQRCNVGSWTGSGVSVLCRTAAGAWADTTFDVAFQR